MKSAVSDYLVQFIITNELIEQCYNIDISNYFKKVLERYFAGISAYTVKHKNEVVLKYFFPVTGKYLVIGYTVILSNIVSLNKTIEFTIQGIPDDYIINVNIGSNAFAVNLKLSEKWTHVLIINPHIL